MEKFKALSTARKACFILFSFLTLFILWFIFSHSAKTATDSSADSAGLSHRVALIINYIFDTSLTSDHTVGYVRIFAHIAEFGALAFTFSASFESIAQKRKAPLKLSIPVVFLIAIFDEIIQIFYEGRAFQVSDIFCDTFGGIIGTAFFALTIKIIFNDQRRKKQ